MFNFKRSDLIIDRVRTYMKHIAETKSKQWVCNLGFQECNDFAYTVTNAIKADATEFIRQDSVSVYVRRVKAQWRNELFQEKLNKGV